MPLLRVRAQFNENTEIGFYQRPAIGKGSARKTFPGRRIRDGQEFDLYYDDDYPLESRSIIDGNRTKTQNGVLADWMEPLEEVKKKPGRRSRKDDVIVDELDADNNVLDA